MVKAHTQCRACGSTELVPVFDLGLQPLANDFHAKSGPALNPPFPLSVQLCKECTLAQLSVVIDPSVLYSNYAYATPPGTTTLKHFERLSADLEAANGVGSVIEIGSNDGLFLEFLKHRGFGPVHGIDPAINLCEDARQRHINTACALFTQDTAKTLQKEWGYVDYIIARHVFAHVDDWKDFVAGLDLLCHKTTVVAIEVPYCGDMIDRCEWDTIYHEHLSYVTLRSMVALLRDTPFTLTNVLRYAIHGGVIVMFLRRKECPVEPNYSLAKWIASENINEYQWAQFSVAALNNRNRLDEWVRDLRNDGKTIIGYGAPAKSTVIISACGWTEKQIACLTDTTPWKIGKVSPNGIPICGDATLLETQPDYAILFPWNYRDEILKRQQLYLDRGGHFIVPILKVEVL